MKSIRPNQTSAQAILDALHKHAGICGHCGEKCCIDKKSYSMLPMTIAPQDLAAVVREVQAS